MLKYCLIVCLFFLCSARLLWAQDDQAFALDREITLIQQDKPLEKVLDEISSKTRLYFSYDPTVLDVQKIVSVHYENRKVKDILDDLFSGEYTYEILKNQVIINAANHPPTEIRNEPADTILKLSGHIKDAEDLTAVPFASISILGKPFGTITNMDGDFEIKIPRSYQQDTLYISCMGYAQKFIDLDTLTVRDLDLSLAPINIRLREVRVTAVNGQEIIAKMMEKVGENYSDNPFLMTAFYREVLKQDGKYINVSEAVMNILKASYINPYKDDRVRFIKGRKSQDVSPFSYVIFKMQGGPYYITRLDVVKTMESFLDKDYMNIYSYHTEQVIEYLGRPTYVIDFKPIERVDFLSYQGKLFVDKESYALVHAEFELGRDGIRYAKRSLIRKKPKDFKVRPIDLQYQVTYKLNDGKWFLNTAQTSVSFKVRSKEDKVNSTFHSISDLLITNIEETDQKRFDKDETLTSTDIFTEMIIDYDTEFWEQYNTIKPNEDLRNAVSSLNKPGSVLDKQEAQPDLTNKALQ